MKKYTVRLIKEDKEAYGGDLGRHGGSGRVRMSQSIKKGDTVQFQVADYRTNTRKYYKGIVMMLKGERGYQRVVSDRAQVKVTHEAEQTYRSSHDQAGTISDFVPVPEPYITEISADELVAVNEAMTEEKFESEQGGVKNTVEVDVEAKAQELAVMPEEAIQKVVAAAMAIKKKQGAGNRKDEAFRGSDEEKEMMKKMSNKEFYDYVTRDRHTVPNLKGDMGPLPGLEGPFQFQDGQVLYYDPKAGKYYDRGKDMYVENPPGNRKDVAESHCGGRHPGNRRIKVRRKK